LSKHFTENEIGEMCCLGRCHENSSFYYGGKNYSGNAIDTIDSIKKINTVIPDSYAVESKGTPILTQKSPDLQYYSDILKKCLSANVAELQLEIKTSGLKGRGGAGFPMAIKLEACRNTKADQRFIVCFGDEGDPGAYSDR
jgi:NADH-quinone oxidoreductase subunit F